MDETVLQDLVQSDMRASLQKAKHMQKFHIDIANTLKEQTITSQEAVCEQNEALENDMKVDTAICSKLRMLFESKEDGETDIEWPTSEELTEAL